MTLKRGLWKESGVDDIVTELRDTRSTGPESPPEASLDVAGSHGDSWASWEGFRLMPGDQPVHTSSVTASLHPGSHHTCPDYSTFLEP